jgi:diguanylate cyclase (GGDEF)-like protein
VLFGANVIMLWTLAAVFMVAGWKRRHEVYWGSWTVANTVLGAALVVFILERHMPPLLTATLPNGLLILGFGLRWRAAREFSGRDAPAWIVWGPLMALVLLAAPWAYVSYAPAFIVTNILLTGLSGAVAYEFWRDRSDGLPSRYGLVVAYGAMGLSFCWRIAIGIVGAEQMPGYMPQDTALVVHLLVAAFHTAASGAFALSLAYERGNAELRHAATHDGLTGILNRRAFEMRLRELVARGGTEPFTLAMLDVDHFKQVNDRFGHAAGDEALRICARTLVSASGPSDVVARIGGEEFAIILAGTDHAEGIAGIERLRRAVGSQQVRLGATRFRLTVSGGLCHSSDAPGDFDEIMRRADSGLYAAKTGGRNRVEKTAA